MKKNWESVSKRINENTSKTVITVDVRNHGESPHTSSHTYHELASDISQLISKLSLKTSHIIGHSMGGRTGMVLALTEPSKIESLIVVDISPVSTAGILNNFFPKLIKAMRSTNFEGADHISKARSIGRDHLASSGLVKPESSGFILMNIGPVKGGSYGWTCNLDTLIKHFSDIATFPSNLIGKQYSGKTLFIGGDESNYIPNAESVELAYSSYESTDTDTSKRPPLVILHGLLGSKNNWNSMSKAIHKATGRKIISVDARNHGDSRHSSQHTYIHMAHDVIKLLKKLEISKVSILGHSMGGRTAMVLSLLCSDLISSLIVVDISPVKTSPQIFSMMNLFDAMTSVSIRSGIAMSKARKLADEQLKNISPDVNLRNFLITNLVQTNTGSYTWRVNLPALKENFQNHISNFPSSLKGLQYCGPSLFIGGSLSDYIGKNDLPEIQEYFPLAELVFIDGAGHWVHSQKPEKFLENVCKFLGDK
ncbi:unnamed protein product [Pieris brassicae]|uniref:sn-1-specific diacylglycerol lipase ABHD11 n=1 Tax=Pieris brassicae TaxID=7116 RepID=A0A9P0TAW8_PIEBR|nr:unnamed protein product [Pieris brassicae]